MRDNEYTYEWIPGYVSIYKISQYGDIVSFTRTKPYIMKTFKTNNGYIAVNLMIPSNPYNLVRQRIVAYLVLETFGSPPPTNQHRVKYKDGDTTNIHISNLEWQSKSDIMRNNINKIKHKLVRRKPRPIVIFTEGRNHACKILNHGIGYNIDTFKPTNEGYYVFSPEAFFEFYKGYKDPSLMNTSFRIKGNELTDNNESFKIEGKDLFNLLDSI